MFETCVNLTEIDFFINGNRTGKKNLGASIRQLFVGPIYKVLINFAWIRKRKKNTLPLPYLVGGSTIPGACQLDFHLLEKILN